MTSRECVLSALNHRECARIPVDFSGHRSSGIAALAYPRLRRALGLPPAPVYVYDVIQQLAIVGQDVLDRFGVDTIEMGRGFALRQSDWTDWTLPDGTPCLVPAWTRIERQPRRWVIRSADGKVLAQMPDGALYFEQTYFPLAEEDGPRTVRAALDRTMWTAIASPPGPIDEDALRAGAQQLRGSTDKAIIGLFGGNLFEIGHFCYRNDLFMMMLAGEPRKAQAFLDELMEIHLEKLDRFLGAVGPFIDIILFGDDLGMQTGPMISPRMYCEFFKPRHQLLWTRAKELADVKVMLHCCGGVRELLPHLIEAGLDAINPVQISCRGMDARALKAEFGQDLTFWGGGCDTREVLANATPRQVAEHVRQQVEIFRPGGGFVFQQVHNILANVPPENIIAMFDAVNGQEP
ncbi:MAG: methyltransferase [Planctomycetes bacterium]|nr:methyltransferase [Planctomycetota bacterium]